MPKAEPRGSTAAVRPTARRAKGIWIQLPRAAMFGQLCTKKACSFLSQILAMTVLLRPTEGLTARPRPIGQVRCQPLAAVDLPRSEAMFAEAACFHLGLQAAETWRLGVYRCVQHDTTGFPPRPPHTSCGRRPVATEARARYRCTRRRPGSITWPATTWAAPAVLVHLPSEDGCPQDLSLATSSSTVGRASSGLGWGKGTSAGMS
jgi:hypothetical protein